MDINCQGKLPILRTPPASLVARFALTVARNSLTIITQWGPPRFAAPTLAPNATDGLRIGKHAINAALQVRAACASKALNVAKVFITIWASFERRAVIILAFTSSTQQGIVDRVALQ